ncbi:MAG: alpha-galactosidase [Eubacteriales bacterium]|nr:alpha-galactosidase [Eubacteriales bacterium]
MAIYQNQRVFHLTDGVVFSRVLALTASPDGQDALMDLYYGPALPKEAAELLPTDVRMSASFDGWREIAPLLYPEAGRGDYRPAACAVRGPDGALCSELRFVSADIQTGKPVLDGLPAVYTDKDEEADTLILHLRDERSGLLVDLSFTVMNQLHALTCSAVYRNEGKETLTLVKSASATLSLRGPHDILHLHGAWARERKPERVPCSHSCFTLRSERGASGHEHNPFLALLEPSANEHQGSVWGASLIWSGSFLMECDQDSRDDLRLTAGVIPCDWELQPGDVFTTPECVLVYSAEGLNGMSHIYHTLYRTRLCRGYWRDRVRPLLVNNWEATYFDFNEEKLMTIAKKAAQLGIELFVLDDGWFGKRDNDDCSLGDWVENPRKLPNGLMGLSEKIHGLGLQFGLWLEPEMISPDSDLYRAHPDWCLHVSDRHRTQARNQLILDLSRTDVQDYLIDMLNRVLSSAEINYIKWDMNRNFAETGSALLTPAQQSSVHVRYMLGLYRVLETITTRFPKVLFESCSGGGGRFDPGMLYYMPQTWTSDDTDAVERVGIQWGTSIVYPCSTMGAHVSAVPNHQIGRVTTMDFRGNVALSGNMGYELDLSTLSAEDLEVIRRQVQQVKRFGSLIQQGRFTRLESPFEGRVAAWQFTSADQQEVLVCVFQLSAAPNSVVPRIRVRDIAEGLYQSDDGMVYSGAVLRHSGLCVSFTGEREAQDHDSFVLHLTKRG